MGQVSSHTTSKEKLITGRITERRQVQIGAIEIGSSIPPTTGPNKRLGIAFHGGVLVDSSSEFLWSSNVQSSIPSNVSILPETDLNKIQDLTHTPSGGTDEENDLVSLAGRLTPSLCSRRSAVTPISVLPPELLVQIFRLYALEEPPWSRGVQKLGWIAVTHVCQLWRQVALGDSSLWARITGIAPNAKWISEMLVRARNAPLVVNAVALSPEILSKLTPHISRIRELRLGGLSVYHSHCLREICALEAPAPGTFRTQGSGPSPCHLSQTLWDDTLQGAGYETTDTLPLQSL